MSDGYLSRNREHLCELQRKRRAGLIRIDYTPCTEALEVIKALRLQQRPGSIAATNSAVIDAIVAEWAKLTGVNKREVEKAMTPVRLAGIKRHQRAGAYDFGADLSPWWAGWVAANRVRTASRRVVCGAKRHRDGQPCRAMSEPGKRRCKWHGGCSTGPITAEGRKRALDNLRQNRKN